MEIIHPNGKKNECIYFIFSIHYNGWTLGTLIQYRWCKYIWDESVERFSPFPWRSHGPGRSGTAGRRRRSVRTTRAHVRSGTGPRRGSPGSADSFCGFCPYNIIGDIAFKRANIWSRSHFSTLFLPLLKWHLDRKCNDSRAWYQMTNNTVYSTSVFQLFFYLTEFLLLLSNEDGTFWYDFSLLTYVL